MTNRLWVFGTVFLIAAMLLGTYFIGIAPAISRSAAAQRDTENVRALNAGHEQTLARLKKDFANIDSLREELADLQTVIPTSPEETPLLAQLHEMASVSGARIDHVTFEDPTDYLPGSSTDPEVVAATGSVSSGNFLVIPVEMKVIGTTAATIAFLREIQANTRFFLAYDMTFEGTDDDLSTDETLLTISGQIFVLTGRGSTADPGAETDNVESPN